MLAVSFFLAMQPLLFYFNPSTHLFTTSIEALLHSSSSSTHFTYRIIVTIVLPHAYIERKERLVSQLIRNTTAAHHKQYPFYHFFTHQEHWRIIPFCKRHIESGLDATFDSKLSLLCLQCNLRSQHTH
jgi:hypothetical protein